MMGENSFLEKYKNRNFIILLENNNIKRFVLSYVSEVSRRTILYNLWSFYKQIKQEQLNFDFNQFFGLDPIDARDLIWSVTLDYIDKKNYQTAQAVKVYTKSLYDFVNERENKVINYRRNQTVPNIRVKKVEVPTHEQIFRLIDSTTHLKVQSMLLLSYVSGLKGAGLINLRLSDIKNAIEDQEKLREELEREIKVRIDSKEIEELNELIENLPLVIRITAELYPKRFRGQSNQWFPALVSKDAQELLLKYYKKRTAKSKDDDLLFPTRNNKPYSQSRLSILLKYNIKKYSEGNNGELADTAPSMLRKAFYNRLISGNMKDLYREICMGHSIGVKGHYFEWELQKKDILLQYVRCRFNRNGNQITKAIGTLQEDLKQKEEQIIQLQNELQYFKSENFTNDIVARIKNTDKNPFDVIDSNPEEKTITVEIPLDAEEELAKLLRDGYVVSYSNNKIFRLVKET